MSVETFIPEIWAAELLSSLKKNLVYAQEGVVNRNYEGEIREFGDSVSINSISRPTIATYTPNSTTITPEQLTTAQRKLLIDQAKYFSFYIDDVDRAQVRNDGGLMAEAMLESSYGLADTADQFVAALYTGAVTDNELGTVTVTSGNAYDKLVDLSVKLDEANVPSGGRWVIVPPWYHGLLRKNTNFINAEKSADGGAALRNGEIGEAAGFMVLKSNNAVNVTGDDFAVMAGYPGAISYAEQIVSTEAYRPESGFEDAVKGLHVYGAKLVRPDGIATMVASKT